MTAPNKMAKRAAAGTLALAVCFTGGVLGAGAAQAAPGFSFSERLGGADRFETAARASQAAFAGGAGDVIIVQDDALADGLTASYVAGLKKAPILYVRQNEVPAATAAELTRLNAERITIVGGTAVVSSGVQSSLASNGRTVTRISGADRYETSARVATSGSNDVGTVFIANGDAPADALAGGPIAYKSNNPILLTQSMMVPASTAAALRQLNETNRIVLGGNAVVSTSTYTELDANNRLSGVNRQGTAAAIADYAVANEGFTRANAALVGPEDRNTADALIAAPLAGQTGTPILFTARDGISEETTKYLNDNADALTGTGYVFGGTAAVSAEDVALANAAAGGDGTVPPVTPPTDGSRGTIAVAPANAVTQVLATEGSQTERDDNRLYTATDLQDGVQYRITLVDSNNIRATDSGVTFRSSTDGASESGYSADIGTDYADIIAVNGGSIAGANTTTAVAVDGTITFEIDGVDVGSVTPVIYLNGGAGKTAAQGGPSIRLETSATAAGEFAAATEAFGLAGQVTYVGQLAQEGAFNSTVASVDKANNTFSTDPGAAIVADPDATPPVPAQPATQSVRYTYDENDTFRLGGQTVNLAVFESQLSSGDGVSGIFVQNASGNSTFNLDDANPGAITDVTVERSSGTGGTVTIEGTFPGALREIDSFIVQRAVIADSDDDGEMDDLGDFTTVATVPASDTDATAAGVQLRYVDQNVPTGEYQYRLAAVNDGDQGPYTASQSTIGSSQNPTTVLDTRLVAGGNDTDPFVLGAGDSFTIATSEVLEDLDGNEQLRISDTDGTVGDFVNGGNATFTLNDDDVTIDGTTYGEGRVITVTINTDSLNQANQQNGVNTLGFPATITDSAGITDENGTKISLTGDVTIENDAPEANPTTPPGGGGNPPVTPPAGTPPTITGAQADSATQVTLTLSELVQSSGGGALDAAQFTYVNGANAAVAATAAAVGAGNTVVLTFPAATVDQAANAADNVVYTDDAVAAAGDDGDVVSADDQTPLANSTTPVADVGTVTPPAGTPPTITGAQTDSATQVTLTLSELVQSSGGGALDAAQFTYVNGANAAVAATAAAVGAGNTVVLTFPAATVDQAANAADNVVYTDDAVAAAGDDGDVVSADDQTPLANSTTPVADAAAAANVAPTVTTAVATDVDEITVTFDQEVDAFGPDATAFNLAQFTFTPPAGGAGGAGGNPTGIAVDPTNANALILTFAGGNGPIAADQATGTIDYDDADDADDADAGDVVDVATDTPLEDVSTPLTAA